MTDPFRTVFDHMLAVQASLLRYGFDPANIFVVFAPVAGRGEQLYGVTALAGTPVVDGHKVPSLFLVNSGLLPGAIDKTHTKACERAWVQAGHAYNQSPQTKRDELWRRHYPLDKFLKLGEGLISQGLITHATIQQLQVELGFDTSDHDDDLTPVEVPVPRKKPTN